jgi:Protein of unknown function (DUF2510)
MDPTQLRWWDGAAWTISTAPDPAHAPAQSAPPPFQYEPTVVVPKQRPYNVVDYVPMATAESVRPTRATDWDDRTRTGASTVSIWFYTLMPLIALGLTYLVGYFLDYVVTVNSNLASTVAQLDSFSSPIFVAYVGLVFIIYLSLASSDRRTLVGRGYEHAPSAWFALIPLLYLIMRVVRTGASSVGYLVVWVVFQALAFAPTILSLIYQPLIVPLTN